MIWWIICGMAAITFLNRYFFLAKSISIKPSESFRRFLSFSSLAVLTALWTPIVFRMERDLSWNLAGWDYLLASVIAVVLCLARASSLLVVLVSTAAFFLLRTLL